MATPVPSENSISRLIKRLGGRNDDRGLLPNDGIPEMTRQGAATGELNLPGPTSPVGR